MLNRWEIIVHLGELTDSDKILEVKHIMPFILNKFYIKPLVFKFFSIVDTAYNQI